MAVICSTEESITTDEVVSWLIHHFYSYKAWEFELEGTGSNIADLCRSGMALEWYIDGGCGAFLHYDVPIHMQETHTGFEMETSYTIKPDCARAYLSRLLEPDRKGQFRLQKLPAELRNRIYHLVLRFDDCEIVARWDEGPKFGLTHASRITQNPAYSKASGQKYSRDLPSDVDSLLASCRQVRHEAKPVFFGANTFLFPSLRGAYVDMKQLHKSQVALLKKISITMRPYSQWTEEHLYTAKEAFKTLPALDECTFNIDDAAWLVQSGPYKNYSLLWSYEDLKGLDGLVAMAAKTKNVKVTCNIGIQSLVKASGCDRFKAFMEEAVAYTRSLKEDP